jgi:hypothetical protein
MLVGWQTRRERRLSSLLLCGLIALALASAACGETTPVGQPSCKSSSACYGIVYWTPSNTTFSGTPQGVMSKIYMRLLYCDASCQSENGFTQNFVMLTDAKLQTWFEVGFRADGANNGNLYFFSGSNFGGTVAYTNMGSVDVPTQIANFINFGVNHVIDLKNSYSPNSVQMIYADPYGGWSTDDFVDNTSTFTPGSIEMGELVHGTHGESADGSAWLSDRYTTTSTAFYPDIAMYPNLLTATSHGQIRQDLPPAAFWLGYTIDGDAFTANCCK